MSDDKLIRDRSTKEKSDWWDAILRAAEYARTPFHCAARGCDGCNVCEPDDE